jgi:hypothetical protein
MILNTIFQITINIVISLLIIYGFQYGYNFLKENYTTKKTKDLVNTQIEKYKKIVDEMQNNKKEQTSSNDNNDNREPNSTIDIPDESSPIIPFKNEKEKKTMNDELTNFINNQI